MTSPMTLHPALLRLLHLLSCCLLLRLRLAFLLHLWLTLLLGLPTLWLVLMLVLMTIMTSNRQGVLVNRQFNIFWSHPWQCHIHLIAILCLADVHRYHQRW